MDRERHSELAFRPLTDSRAQRAPASTQLAFSGRWTGGMVREAGSISSSSTKPGFLLLLQPFFFFFSFATTSNLPLSSYSNKTIICSNEKWENGGGHLQDTRTLRNPIRCVNKVKSAGFLLLCHSEGFAPDTSEVFNKRRRNFFMFSFRYAGKNQRHVLPRLLNICVLGRALSESCYFCLGDSAGDEARKKHRLLVSFWLPFPQGRLPANRAIVVADWKADKVNQTCERGWEELTSSPIISAFKHHLALIMSSLRALKLKVAQTMFGTVHNVKFNVSVVIHYDRRRISFGP